eukprot:4481957-Prymnesium_polylepis.1
MHSHGGLIASTLIRSGLAPARRAVVEGATAPGAPSAGCRGAATRIGVVEGAPQAKPGSGTWAVGGGTWAPGGGA